MPALPVALGMSVGIALHTTFGIWPWAGVGAVAAVLLFFMLFRNTGITSFSVAVGLGVLVSWFNRPAELPENMIGEKTVVTGRVDEVTVTDLTTRIVITPLNSPVTGRLLVAYRGGTNEMRLGVTIEVSGTIVAPDEQTDLPRQTDFNKYLKLDGIVGRMNVYTRSDMKVIDHTRDRLTSFCDDTRAGWLDAIVNAGFNEETTAFMLAVLGGDDLMLDSSLEERFRDNGLAHLLAISGMHLAIIVMLLGWMLYAMKLSPFTRRLYYIILMVGVGLFTVASGASPSVCRAAAMAVVMLGCGLFETTPNPGQALAVSVSLCLFFKPIWLLAPGFQLSVVAVTGLLVFGQLTNRIPIKNRIGRLLLDLLIIPVVALMSTMALTIFYFHTIPVNFWLANIVAAAFIPFLLCFGFVTVILSLVGLPAGLPAVMTDSICELMNRLVTLIDSVGWPPMTVFLTDLEIGVVAMALVTAGWFCLRPGKFSGVGTLVMTSVAAAVIVGTERSIPAGELYVPRHSRSTDIIVADNGRVMYWNISRRGDDDVSEMLNRNYRDFFRYHRVETADTLPDSYHGKNVSRAGDQISIGSTVLCIIRNDSTKCSGHLDYALLSGDYKGNVEFVSDKFDVDTVLIPRQMHHRRAARLMSRLADLGQPCRRLTDRPLAIIKE